MIASKNRIKLLSGIILFLVIPISGCGYVGPMFFPVNVEIPVDLSKAGSVSETEFQSFFKDDYALYLKFFYSDNSGMNRNELLTFLGDGGHDLGKKIPVSLLVMRVDDKEEKIVLKKTYITNGLHMMNGKAMIRNLSVLCLEPGKYKIQIKNEKDFLELSDTQIFLNIRYFRVK